MTEENQPQQESSNNSPEFIPQTEGETPPPSPQQRLTDRILPSFPKLQTWWDSILGLIRAILPETLSSKLNDFALTGIVSGLVVAILLTTVALIPAKKPELAQNIPPEPAETPIEVTAPELSPEQKLIVAIQQRVNTITGGYPGNLIESVVANSPLSLVTIQLHQDWYQLGSSEQDEIVEDLLGRSQNLNFHKLKIKDTQGRLLARNSFIGEGMLITLR